MHHGVTETWITIALFVCFIVVAIPSGFLSLWMRVRVNEQLLSMIRYRGGLGGTIGESNSYMPNRILIA